LFRRGDVPREVRLLAAQGTVAPRAHEQLAILVLLTGDRDPDVSRAAEQTIAALPLDPLTGFLGRCDVSGDVRAYFAARGILPAATAMEVSDAPLIDLDTDAPLDDLERELEGILGAGVEPDAAEEEAGEGRRSISLLPVIDKIKLAMRGTREQRAVLVRDSNKLVSVSVLSSPKLTESEVETFARMGNVTEEVLRIIGSNRTWTRNYSVMSALAKNPKTPPTISMPLVSRLNERDLKSLSIDRNAPEGLRITARKLLMANQSRRE
jgi:hypothetical protein